MTAEARGWSSRRQGSRAIAAGGPPKPEKARTWILPKSLQKEPALPTL